MPERTMTKSGQVSVRVSTGLERSQFRRFGVRQFRGTPQPAHTNPDVAVFVGDESESVFGARYDQITSEITPRCPPHVHEQ
jgi:hypothetical protein